MGYLGRRIGLSQDQGDSNPGGAGGAVGGGLLDLFAHGYFERQGDLYNNPGASPSALTATGGVISDYTSGSDVYRAHVFTSSGALNVVTESYNSAFPNSIELLLVAGGGGASGGTGEPGGGGGAGSVIYKSEIPVSAQSYTITIGSGGAGGSGVNPGSGWGNDGGNSTAFSLTADGGGAGGWRNARAGQTGGSGGGGTAWEAPGSNPGPATGATAPAGVIANPTSVDSPDAGWGHAGGQGTPSSASPYAAAGGGGAGAVGSSSGSGRVSAPGGNGLQFKLSGSPTLTAQPAGDPGTYGGGTAPGPMSGGGWFGGGGAGSCPDPTPGGQAKGGLGGGGIGRYTAFSSLGPGSHAMAATGGGGSGGFGHAFDRYGGSGGSGICIVRYKIAQITATAKATGGEISFYGGKTIHVFTSSGNFITPGSFDETVEYVVVGGGGAGGGPASPGLNSYYGGGGGAGTIKKNSIPISSPQTIAVTVGAGGASNKTIGFVGSDSLFGPTIPAPGGGFGGTWRDPGAGPLAGGGPGGSSGGANYGGSVQPSTGDPFVNAAAASTPNNGWGHPGGTGAPQGNSGGGGGAGGGGGVAPATAGGQGGVGMQLPATFRNPISTVGAPGPTNIGSDNPGWTGIDNSGKFWVAAGGGGSSFGPNASFTSGTGGGNMSTVSGPHAGAGNGSRFFAGGTAALQNSGSGGGGSERAPGAPNPQVNAGAGGSGLVLIAYPS